MAPGLTSEAFRMPLVVGSECVKFVVTLPVTLLETKGVAEVVVVVAEVVLVAEVVVVVAEMVVVVADVVVIVVGGVLVVSVLLCGGGKRSFLFIQPFINCS